jgi:heme exporter protein A
MQGLRRLMRLIVTDLAATRGGRPVFAGRSFAVADGELMAVTGPNGSGKSTLLRLVAGLITPSAGSIRIEPAGEGGIAAVAHYLGHLDALKPALTLRDNLAFWHRLWGGTVAVDDALDAVGLGNLGDLPAGVLSAGQRRRAAIARLLLAHRPLWLLDEPATALDAAAEATLARLIGDHLAAGGMAIVAQHRPLAVQVTAELNLGEAA